MSCVFVVHFFGVHQFLYVYINFCSFFCVRLCLSVLFFMLFVILRFFTCVLVCLVVFVISSHPVFMFL